MIDFSKLKPARDVAIIGIGSTRFGEHWDKSLRDLAGEAGSKALHDANIEPKDIQFLVGGNMSGGMFVGQEHAAGLFADQLGITPVGAIRTEAACASGSLAVRVGYMGIASGLYDVVAVGGAEKMTDVYGDRATSVLAGAMDQENEAFHGLTFPGVYAFIANRHMHDFGTTRKQLALIPVKNHKNGAMNPIAHFQREITIDDVLKSPLVADPLRLMDCSPISDGAASLIMIPADKAKEYTDNPVYIKASAQASDTLAVHDRREITTLDATVVASKEAYARTGLKPADIDIAEIHDCFSINELIAYEDLGFAKKGEGGKLIESGETEIGGRIPVNTSGGLKAKGYPVGATGVSQLVELVEQLRGEAGKRQVENARYGLAHNVGGSGATVVIHILSNER